MRKEDFLVIIGMIAIVFVGLIAIAISEEQKRCLLSDSIKMGIDPMIARCVFYDKCDGVK